jgi:predicted secreted protein
MAENGNKRKVYLTDGKGTGTFTWVAGETSSNLSLQRNMIETSDKSSEHATFIAGRQSGTGSVTVNLDDSATDSQRKMVKAFHDGQTIFVFQGEVGGTDTKTPINGTAYEALISGLDRDYPDDAVVAATFNLQLTGAPLEYPSIS